MLSGEAGSFANYRKRFNSVTFHVQSKQMDHYDRTVTWAKGYLGGVCVECGTTKDLEFDHIDRATKSFEVRRAFRSMARDKLIPELDKCQLLCGPHHSAKTSAEMGVAHGGGASGKKNCKCDPCKLRKAEYMRNWKRQKKGSIP